MDDDIGTFELFSPCAEAGTVPEEGLPGRWTRSTREYGDGVACTVKVTGEDVADLSSASRNDDLHARYSLSQGSSERTSSWVVPSKTILPSCRTRNFVFSSMPLLGISSILLVSGL